MSKNRKGSADADRHSPLDPNKSSPNYTISGGVDRNTAIACAFFAAVKRREMDRRKGREVEQ